MREITIGSVPAGAALGYTLYLNGQQVGGRITAGLAPVGAGTGVYRAVIDETTCDLVIWDTGGSTPKFVQEDIFAEAGSQSSPAPVDTPTNASGTPGDGSVIDNGDGTQTAIFSITEDSQHVYTGIKTRVAKYGVYYPEPPAPALSMTATTAPSEGSWTTEFRVILPSPLLGFSGKDTTSLAWGKKDGLDWPGDGLPYVFLDALSDGTADSTDGNDPSSASVSSASVDADITLGPALTDISAGSSLLYTSDQPGSFVHVLTTAIVTEIITEIIAATDSNTSDNGATSDGSDGMPPSYTVVAPKLALVRTRPTAQDFVTGDWLTRTGVTPAETYARLDTSLLTGDRALVRGAAYFVYVQITISGQAFIRKAPKTLSVR